LLWRLDFRLSSSSLIGHPSISSARSAIDDARPQVRQFYFSNTAPPWACARALRYATPQLIATQLQSVVRFA
jgi:hypothetical protein